MFLFLTLSLPELAKVKIRQKLHISFRQIPKQKQHHLKVPTSFFEKKNLFWFVSTMPMNFFAQFVPQIRAAGDGQFDNS